MFKRSAGTLNRTDSPATRKKQKVAEGDTIRDEGEQLLKAVESLKEKSTRRDISAEFQKLPSRKHYPDYYQLIKKPIALDVIHKNLDDGEYVTLELLREDLLQMCNNAKRYNQKGSQLYSDAAQIARLVKNWSGDAENYSEDSDLEEATKELSARNYRTMLNQIIRGIMKDLRAAKDRSGRHYCDIFLELPDRKLYPDYYTIITNPLAINPMEVRMKKNPYTKIEKFHENINQLYDNAFIYNDARSQVAQDARHLQRLTNKLIEQARPLIAQKEKELAEQAKEQNKTDARTPKTTTKIEPPSTGGFKIKLGLRQPPSSSTPIKTPTTKIKLHLGGARNSATAAKQESPVNTPAPEPVRTPTPAAPPPIKSPTPAPTPAPVPSHAPSPAPPERPAPESAPTPPVSRAKSATPAPVTPAATTVPAVNPYEARPATTAATLTPTNVFDTPLTYINSGSPLILFLSLCASQTQPPMILHIPAIPGMASLMYSWTLPITASAMTVSPSLCQTLLDGKRGYAVTMALNGRKIMASRQANSQTTIKNSIWDLKLSAGMNCIECIVEAESSTPASAAVQAEIKTGSADGVEIPPVEKPLTGDGKDRERTVVLAFLR